MAWVEVNLLRDLLQQLDLLPAVRNCPGCAVVPGQPHQSGCAVERCSACGSQRLACSCNGDHDALFSRWTGFWPGELECLALGLLSKWEPDPQHPVPADTLCRKTSFDLNRFIENDWGKLLWRKPARENRPEPGEITPRVTP